MARHAYDLAGKVVVITGGNGGIGGATARELFKRGAQVAIVDIDPRTPELAATLNPDAAIGLVGDVRDRAALESAVAQTVERFGRLDIAIANAGLLARAATLRVTPATAIENTLAVNVGGVVNTVAASVEEVIANQGQIVLISSVFAFLNGMGTIPYAMSKAAVEQLGRGLRVELADHGVSVTTAYFSLVDTDMIKQGVDEDPVVVELLSTLPGPMLKRVTPQSAAAAIADGLERRDARVMHPGRWKPVSALRGLVGFALDERLVKDRKTLDILARLDARGRPSHAPRRTLSSTYTSAHAPKGSRMTTWKDVPTRTVDVNGVPFAYRELGAESEVPVVFLHHFTAVMDDWDPRVIDGIAEHHRVIAFDNRGVGASGSKVPAALEKMGADAVAFIRALGHDKVDLFGFSVGGAVAQMVALQAPDLVRRMVLAGTGPRGGGGIWKMPFIVGNAYAKAFVTRKDPRHFLFFPRTAEGKKAATEYFERLAERTRDRDKPISPQGRLAQLRAITTGGLHAPDDLSSIKIPVFVANGDHDLMVASEHSADMARRLPDATLKIYPNSGHGGVFQHYREFVPDALQFLAG
jgi:NAD(P)-dependent dehydrogenase (short-subunit alcohol dehydrogenase family)/pimeloyl-ACP methyl ester carboxylesterase